jgi:hypothetical protein
VASGVEVGSGGGVPGSAVAVGDGEASAAVAGHGRAANTNSASSDVTAARRGPVIGPIHPSISGG